jgi:hypothetical protein
MCATSINFPLFLWFFNWILDLLFPFILFILTTRKIKSLIYSNNCLITIFNTDLQCVTVGPLISGVICDLTVDIKSIKVVVSTCAEKSGHSKKWKCFITLLSSPCKTKLISIEQNYLFFSFFNFYLRYFKSEIHKSTQKRLVLLWG